MFHPKDVLSDQLLANANDPSWYVPFSESIKNLTEAEAFWKVNEESNSIAEIVQHLLYWNETWQTRYQENSVHAVPNIGGNDSTFTIAKNKTFYELQQQLLEVLLHWQKILTEQQLESEVQGYFNANWWQVLGNITTHNAYHISQIVYIRKIQKSWHNSDSHEGDRNT
ncbi:DinB family protein [Lysinibacillus mangiferihumi]|uniref:DinB family protein n=1 Tax=Lysinibacillus mangiferihumi TaxID=1130819 RepID=A0A4U2ZB90_9BACI|nr:DinB family protein [Lysinibacillus mangiferihumi]TKI71648.1 DinB family protein [Lysinibacillus mangiferihumi]